MPGSINAVAGPSPAADPVAMSERSVDVAARSGSTRDTAVNVAGSIVRVPLDGRELAGPGAATRAVAAMSAANATMSLVRTMPAQRTGDVKRDPRAAHARLARMTAVTARVRTRVTGA